MKRVFLDIGAHLGETLHEVSKPQYSFDTIFAFEPSPRCHKTLYEIAAGDPRIIICPFGLSNRNTKVTLLQSGSQAATTINSPSISVLESQPTPSDEIDLYSVSSWIKSNLDPSDLIVAKINCEGGEVDILDDLLNTNTISYFYNLMIAFDIRYFPRLMNAEPTIRARLRHTRLYNTCFSDDVMIGPTHSERISHWLSIIGIDSYRFPSVSLYKIHWRSTLRQYSLKRGQLHRFEARFKHHLRYSSLPHSIKSSLRSLKTLLKLNRDRHL